MGNGAGLRSLRLTRGRVALLLGIVTIALGVLTASQWRGDEPTPAGVAGVEDARHLSQATNGALFPPLRFVEAHVVPARCMRGYTLTAYISEPTVSLFGGQRVYAIGQSPPTSCTFDCVGTIVGATRAEYDAAIAGGGASPCA